MSNNPFKKPVTYIVVSAGILVIAAAGVLINSVYNEVTDPVEFENVSVFDPSRLPAPAAGVPAQKYTQSCDNIIFSTTKGGVRYVRQKVGSVVIGAEYNDEFGFYKLEYGVLKPIDSNAVDQYDKAKLKYALYNCDGPYVPTGAEF